MKLWMPEPKNLRKNKKTIKPIKPIFPETFGGWGVLAQSSPKIFVLFVFFFPRHISRRRSSSDSDDGPGSTTELPRNARQCLTHLPGGGAVGLCCTPSQQPHHTVHIPPKAELHWIGRKAQGKTKPTKPHVARQIACSAATARRRRARPMARGGRRRGEGLHPSSKGGGAAGKATAA